MLGTEVMHFKHWPAQRPLQTVTFFLLSHSTSSLLKSQNLKIYINNVVK